VNPQEVLAGIEAFTDARIVGELAGGPTSDSYLVKRGKDQYVLRLDTDVATALGLDRIAEAKILQFISQNGLGPMPKYSAPDRGVLVTCYIEGRAWSDTDLHDAGKIQKLAMLLQRLHALNPEGHEFNLHARIANYGGIIGSVEGRELADETQKLLSKLEMNSTDPCLCHNDLISANIIEGQGLALIDWEYAAMGDACFDLATIAEHHQFDQDEAEVLLSAYFGQVLAEHVSRLSRYRVLYSQLLLLWSAAVDQLCETSFDQRVQLQQMWCRWSEGTAG
jgi:thiamine kinase